MTTRKTPEQVEAFFWDARRRSEKNTAIAANIVYDAGFAAGCEFVALQAQTRTTHPTRAEVIADRARPVIEAVAQRHQTTPAGVCATFPRGAKANTEARDEACWLLRMAGLSYPAIATALGLKCHTSAMDGVARTEARIGERAGLRDELLALMAGERRALRSVG